MAVTTKVYGNAVKHLDAGGINWTSDTIKIALVTNSYVPDQGNDEFWVTPQADEIAGSGGYTTGGFTLTGCTKTYDATTREDRFIANNLSVAALTPSAAFRYAIIYDATPGTAATDILLAYINFGADQNPAGLPFAIQWPATGIFYGQAS